MLQIIQDLRSGETRLSELPAPTTRPGEVLIRTHRSLVSRGTERMLVEFGRAGWIEKARSQPERVRQVLEKIRTDGLQPTLEAVFRKLGEPLPLGYCNAGEVIGVGEGVKHFRPGDRVISNGPHAEIVSVPENLVARIPEGVSYDEAAFTVVGAIALQGIRLVAPTFGETVVVTGLGLIGQLTAQLLRANGCRVIGLDFDPEKVALAAKFDVEALRVGDREVVERIHFLTDGHGADAVIITASSSSDKVISEAARMCRKRGRIVLVGVVGLNLNRADFFEKELSFRVSCSYGPGRYDDHYEREGLDYPIGFVRWTEQRNFRAFLAALASGSVRVKPLISETVDLKDYREVYDQLSAGDRIASLLRYPAEARPVERIVTLDRRDFSTTSGTLAVIGAGNFTRSTVLPALRKVGAPLKYLVSAGGLSGTLAARKFGVAHSVTDDGIVLEDPEVAAVIITTRHGDHANRVIAALEAGKHVFVEKPLALTMAELNAVDEAYRRNDRSLAVGFNRRFSPAARQLKTWLGEDHGPLNLSFTVNAGAVPADSWIHHPREGGGRIVGEACHFVDLAGYFTGSRVKRVLMNGMGPTPDIRTDNAILLLDYADGSQATINYFSNGNKGYPKERIEVFSAGRTAVIENFRKLRGYGFSGRGWSGRQDKGHREQFRRFHRSLTEGGAPIIPYAEIMNTSRTVILALESLTEGGWIEV